MTERLSGAEPFLFEAGPVGCLLVHGFTGAPFEMRELGEYLAERGITTLGPLLPGHGTTPEDMNRTGWRDWYGAAEDVLRDLQARCDPVFVCGLSLGGAITLHLAAHHPELAGIAPLAAPIFVRHPLLPFMPVLKHVIHYFPKGEEDIHDPEARARHVAYPVNPIRCVESLLAFLAHLRDDLPEVRVPALLIHARQDKEAPPENLPYIFERIRSQDKEMLWLDRGGHPVTVDYDKAIVFQRVHQFIAARATECSATN